MDNSIHVHKHTNAPTNISKCINRCIKIGHEVPMMTQSGKFIIKVYHITEHQHVYFVKKKKSLAEK